MRFKLAILTVLANRPGGHATLDEVRREVGIIIATGDQTEQLKRFSAIGDIDIFQSGLVIPDDQGLQITDAGRSLLRSLQSPNPTSVAAPSTSPALGLIDDLIGGEERLRIFDLELRALDGVGEDTGSDPHQSEQVEENESETIGTRDASSEAGALDQVERTDGQIQTEADDRNHAESSSDQKYRTIAIEPRDAAAYDVPAFLTRSFGSKDQDTQGKSLPLASVLAFISTKRRLMSVLWRRHVSESIPSEKTERLFGGAGSAAFALLSLLVVVTCAGAAIALGQINSLKSDIAMLHRELIPLRERLEKLEQAEKTKRDPDQRQEVQNKSDTEKNKPGGETTADQTALNLSREEVQLIREYIKPAPSAGIAAPAIKVGDFIGVATIPLPSPLTEKVPKLAGARFTTRNGAIIISTKNSRRADIVLTPN